MSRPIEWNGKQYPSHAALSRATGMSHTTISQLRASGTLHRLGQGTRLNHAHPVTFDEVHYESKIALARAAGMSHAWLNKALREGRDDDIRKRLTTRNESAKQYVTQTKE